MKLFRWGGDCYAYGLLAAGHVDLVVENSLKLYDFAALAPVIKGAGGMITDWKGRELDMRSNGSVLAAGDPRSTDPLRQYVAGLRHLDFKEAAPLKRGVIPSKARDLLVAGAR